MDDQMNVYIDDRMNGRTDESTMDYLDFILS